MVDILTKFLYLSKQTEYHPKKGGN